MRCKHPAGGGTKKIAYFRYSQVQKVLMLLFELLFHFHGIALHNGAFYNFQVVDVSKFGIHTYAEHINIGHAEAHHSTLRCIFF